MPRLGEQRLGRRNILRHDRQLGVLGVDRGDVVMLAGRTETTVCELQDLRRVGGQPERLAHPRIIPRCGVHPAPYHRRLRRRDLVDIHMRQGLDYVDRQDVGGVEAVNLLRRRKRRWYGAGWIGETW